MVKLEIILDEPSIDLASGSQCRSSSVPLSGRVLLTVDKPTQMKAVSLKYECINSHIDIEGEVYVYYNLHRSTKVIPLGCSVIPVGLHEYPFTFLVPRNLPPSLKAPLGAVNHRLRARVKRVGHVPNLLYKMTGVSTMAKVPLTVHNSDHTSPQRETNRPSSPDDPPAYSSNRRQWSGQRRNGQIDWSIQGPASVHMSHRIDVLAKLRIAKGYGVVDSAIVDLIQVEKYQAEPDPTVWTFPIEQMNEDDDMASGSDDGFPETRTTGVSLKQAVALTPFGNPALTSHCREKRSQPLKPITKSFPPPPDPSSNNTGYMFHLALSLPVPSDVNGLYPTHTSPLITIYHRLRIRFTFSPAGTKELGMILPIVILPTPTPNSVNALAVAELNSIESADGAENFWMVLVEEEGESGPIPQRSRMNSGGSRGRAQRELAVPPQYDDPHWPLHTQERRGSIPMGITV